MSDTTIISNNNAFITQIIEVHEPIISAAQGPQGIASVNSLALLTDISMAGLTDGALLVYNSESTLWEASTILDKQVLDSGQY